jgi:hypothetical protein
VLQSTRPLAKTASAIGLVDRVYHRDSNEVRQHEAYLRLLNMMKRAIRKSLVYTSILIGPDDVEQEQVSGPLWTEGAKQEYEGGVQFMRARPGPPLSESREALSAASSAQRERADFAKLSLLVYAMCTLL